MAVLGIIPARGGSKRVPRKNATPLGGEPLVGWTIGAAKDARLLDRVVVSTDDDEIVAIARARGCEAIRRPPAMAADNATSYPLIVDALDQVGEPFDYICLLQPTSPFRLARDIDGAVGTLLMVQGEETATVPCLVTARYDRAVPNGAIYVARTDWLRDQLAIGVTHPFDEPFVPFYYMPPERSIDIDTEDDWSRAEAMLCEAVRA